MHDHFKMASNVGGNDSVLVSLDIFEGDFEDIIEVLKVDEYINEFSNDLCEDVYKVQNTMFLLLTATCTMTFLVTVMPDLMMTTVVEKFHDVMRNKVILKEENDGTKIDWASTEGDRKESGKTKDKDKQTTQEEQEYPITPNGTKTKSDDLDDVAVDSKRKRKKKTEKENGKEN
ncbi:uncharacterized protein LOC130614112 isoform X1 [Hydractinia symbiolongicarpus]|uniref:uncharacterized protein LOC130614112 isoform X1 n=1 Tax=Hydractinia symbiolongicarpus TaxID=13093 RepID=UPI00254EFA84|nr:uncharacterized protein LOC130614112 isoform X1 [Hydractinia symbiolongicarpus]